MDFSAYDPEAFYDELFDGPGRPKPGARLLVERLESLPAGELVRSQKAAEAALLQMGVTFTVYGEEAGTERIWPFDLVPRIVPAADWHKIESGLRQRIYSLNLFINDIYHEKKIIRDKIVPKEIIFSSKGYRPECEGFNPPRGIWCHITGTDLIRDTDGTIYVLEDNLRCPSGVSYVLENRQILKRTLPVSFEASRVHPVDDYPSRLLEMLEYVNPAAGRDATVAVLTPGIYNSAYFEHSFLARQMGIELVEGRDLVVNDGIVSMKTTKGTPAGGRHLPAHRR